mmetsp:Transcript_3802/g.5690  ORF Transcript_3802/g.5690 Transcript_3802/m.5690 type:complete len:253 (-) Transcript_3802:648-1406(-)
MLQWPPMGPVLPFGLNIDQPPATAITCPLPQSHASMYTAVSLTRNFRSPQLDRQLRMLCTRARYHLQMVNVFASHGAWHRISCRELHPLTISSSRSLQNHCSAHCKLFESIQHILGVAPASLARKFRGRVAVRVSEGVRSVVDENACHVLILAEGGDMERCAAIAIRHIDQMCPVNLGVAEHGDDRGLRLGGHGQVQRGASVARLHHRISAKVKQLVHDFRVVVLSSEHERCLALFVLPVEIIVQLGRDGQQ